MKMLQCLDVKQEEVCYKTCFGFVLVNRLMRKQAMFFPQSWIPRRRQTAGMEGLETRISRLTLLQGLQ